MPDGERQIERDDEHRVTPLELFFDLVLVFAFTQVTSQNVEVPCSCSTELVVVPGEVVTEAAGHTPAHGDWGGAAIEQFRRSRRRRGPLG
jgi:hypothetical protein